MHNRTAKGFSLIELMVVVAIIGIIGAIAYPSYQNYIQDTYQAQAVADLKMCSLALERYYSNGFTYEDADDNDVCTEHSPSDGPAANAQFDLTYNTLSASNFIIQMTPVSGTCAGRCIRLTRDGTQTTL